MEEVDNIIIESLKNIHCSIEDEVTTIKEFDPDTVVDAVACCLETINPQVKYPHRLPSSMSARLKLTTNLAEAIRELDFRGDIGYQTILYCNEIEVRRVLMFLIERLPRESDDILPMQELGKVQKLKREIAENVKLALTKSWVPPSLLSNGMRQSGNVYFQQSCMHVFPLKTECIVVPQTYKSVSEDVRQYWIHNVLDVTKQCSNKNLIPSLLFKDTDLNSINLRNDYEIADIVKENIDVADNVIISKPDVKEIAKDNKIEMVESSTSCDSILGELQNKLAITEECKAKILGFKEEIKANKIKLAEVLESKIKEEAILKEYIAQYKVKSKTLTVLSNEENMGKLKNLVQNGNDRLEILKQQWEEVQTPLLKEYEELQQNVNNKELKIQHKQSKIKDVRQKTQQLMSDLKTKEKMEKQLREECERFSKTTGRSAYTKRILEIIGNINKQNKEIQKILDDTRQVQKEINNLNGQLDRSFTLSDELIFRNAIQDEMSRKAYKLLATLHNDCGAVIQAITELGLTERESRNLQEQIDSEVMKSTGVSLERVNADLQNVRKEIATLQKEIKT